MTEKGGKVQKISSFSLCGAFFIPILQVSPNKSLYLQSQLLAESPNGWNAGIDTYIHKGVPLRFGFDSIRTSQLQIPVKNKATGTPLRCIVRPHWLLVSRMPCADVGSTYTAWGFQRCSFRQEGQCEGLYRVERVTGLAPRFFVYM